MSSSREQYVNKQILILHNVYKTIVQNIILAIQETNVWVCNVWNLRKYLSTAWRMLPEIFFVKY